MSFLLAAFLGNICAWCVHVVAWWLREKCLWLIGSVGYIIAASSIMPLFFILAFSSASNSDSMLVYAVWSFFALLGFCQRKWIGVDRRLSDLKKRNGIEREVGHVQRVAGWQTFFSVGTMYAEIAIAVCLSYWISINVEENTTFFIAVALTLLILSLIRPQVVKVQKWLWQTVWPQRATDE